MTDRPWRAWEVNARRRGRDQTVALVRVRRQSNPTLAPDQHPADLPVEETPTTQRLIGFAGRPTNKHRAAIEQEMMRRAACGQLCETMKGEALYLVEWCRATHGDSTAPTSKTLQNTLRKLYRELKSRNSS